MIILLIIIVIFWTAVILKSILFWVYLWQLKEYRYDRLRAHFELRSSRTLLINKKNIFVGGLLVASFIPSNTVNIATVLIALLLYGFFGSRLFSQLQDHSLKFPHFTSRAAATISISVLLYAAGTLGIIFYTPPHLLKWIFLGDLAVPLVVLLGVLALRPLALMLKKRIMQAATRKREKMKNVMVIGISGSYGKTSMKEYLYSILTRQFKVLKTEENTNSELGVAQTILNKLSNDYDIFIAEMGAYKKGEIAQMAEMAKPQIGILTGLNQQHLSLFGSMQNIQAAKYELIESLPEKGLAVFNGDDPYTRALFRQSDKPKRLYTTDSGTEHREQNIRIESIKNSRDGMEIKIKEGNETAILKTSLLGKHNVTNLLGAVTVARALGMEYRGICEGVKSIQAPNHTLQIKKGIKESIVIDDTYSANISGVFVALDVLQKIPGRQKICILQPLIELGPIAEKVHRQIGGRIADVCDWCIVTSRDYFPSLYKEALDAGMSKDAIFCIPTVRSALRKAQELTDKGDVILLENRLPEELIKGLIIHSSSE